MSDLLGAAMVDIRAIADGARVELNSAQLDVLAAGRTAVLAALASGTRPVYGVNTGMGRFADVPLTLEQQAQHQRNLLIGRAVGGPPWLPERDVRGLLAARLQDFLAPEAGVSAELVRFLADRLNDGFVPAVPRAGLGSAGEIIPLAHAFQTFAGIGTVLDGDDEIPAADALSRRGVEPYVLGPKEGVSLIQGAPLARAHAVLRGVDAARAVEVTLLCTAGAVDILGAPLAGYDPALGGADSVLTDVLGEVFALVKVAAVREGVVQAPVSARVGPRAIAHARRVLRELAETVERAVGVPADSPAFIDGEFVSTTGFHAADLGLRMDAVTAALVHLGEIGVQRLHRMLDERFTGLPAQLAAEPGPHAGLSRCTSARRASCTRCGGSRRPPRSVRQTRPRARRTCRRSRPRRGSSCARRSNTSWWSPRASCSPRARRITSGARTRRRPACARSTRGSAKRSTRCSWTGRSVPISNGSGKG